jgi:predicted acyl esterase
VIAVVPDQVVRVLPDVRVPMRDGVHLSARIYLPPTDQPAPTLLRYTPYLNDGFSNGLNDVAQRFFASRGFAAVSVDFRGYGESDGVPPPAFADQEAIDGFDALAWLAAQPWSTGRTGIWGASYGGNTALAIAALRPPSLRAIVPIHAIDSEFQGAGWPHGCRGALVGEVDWGPRMIGTQLLPPLGFGNGWTDRWRARLEALDQPFPFAWHTIPPETWARWTTDISAIEVPTLAVSAWHDSYPRETLDYVARLRSEKRLILGPWKHELPDYARHDPIGFFEIAAAWLGHFLGDGSVPLPDLAPVTFFETLGRGWRTADTWPPKTAVVRTLHGRTDGTLGDAPTTAGEITYSVDPTVGLAALPWDWTTPTPSDPPDISPDDHRAATWTTAPFAEPLLITGDPAVVVRLSSDRPDVPLRAWLSDVRQDGSSTLIAQGWVRPAHVTGGPLPADRPVDVRVVLAPTSYRLASGHRLRVCVAGSHFPALVPAPDHATFTIALGPDGTHVDLPIEPIDGPTTTAPPWPERLTGAPAAQLESTSRHVVERDLDGADGRYQQSRRTGFALAAGGELTWEIASSAAVARDDPAAMRLESAQTWRIKGRSPAVEVRVSAWQTFDEQEVSAEIDLDGRRFFERQWRLSFGAYPWRIRR